MQLGDTIVCMFVRTPDGTLCKCRVLEFLPSPYTLLPMVGVKAMEGRPFNGGSLAIVKMGALFSETKKGETDARPKP